MEIKINLTIRKEKRHYNSMRHAKQFSSVHNFIDVFFFQIIFNVVFMCGHCMHDHQSKRKFYLRTLYKGRYAVITVNITYSSFLLKYTLSRWFRIDLYACRYQLNVLNLCNKVKKNSRYGLRNGILRRLL